MKKRVPTGAGLISILAALAAPPDAAPLDCPAQQVVIEARFVNVTDNFSRFIGVGWGFSGNFIASDGLQDRLVGLSTAGQVTSSQPLGLFAFNLTPANGKIFFNALDASGRSVLGRVAGSTVSSQFLANGFLNQGGALGMRPDETGVSLSIALSALQSIDKGRIVSAPRVVTSPGKPAVVAVAPWDGRPYVVFKQGSSSILGGLMDDGTVSPVLTLPGQANAMIPCGDTLVVGGVSLLVRQKITDSGQITMEVTPTSDNITGLSCWQDGSVMYVAQGRKVGVGYRNGTTQTYAVPVLGDLAEVATGTGASGNALLLNVLNNQGSLILAQLPYSPPADRNSTTGCRLPSPLLTFLTPKIIGSN